MKCRPPSVWRVRGSASGCPVAASSVAYRLAPCASRQANANAPPWRSGSPMRQDRTPAAWSARYRSPICSAAA
ncbi:hypothetical protein G6F23_014390 [Rhizopus arrhizus]|nr:hypothetical protein G6F23_014390 [Rhizopus arrhizus]